MTKKEIFIKALTCNKNLKFPPFWELEFHLWDAFSGKKLYVGEQFCTLSAKEKEVALHTNVEIMATVSNEVGFSGITAPGNYWEIAPGKPAYYWLPEGYRKKQIEMIQKELGDEMLVIVNTGGILAMPGADHFVDFSLKMFTHPEEIDMVAKENLEKAQKEIREYAEIGIEAFMSASDLADSKSPYFAPDQMERFITPYLHKWSDFIKAIGGYSILHTDGNVNMYMDIIATSGINGLQALDPTADMDIVTLHDKYSDRLCFCGNIDIGILNTAEPGKVQKLSEELLAECGAKGSFVFGGSNAIQHEIPKKNYQAMVDAFNNFKLNY